MLRLSPIGPHTACKELQSILEQSNTPFDELPNFLKVLANSVAALKAYVESEEALQEGQLTPGFREQIALAVAEINDCNYCLASHAMAGKEAGLTDEEIRLARKAAALDPKAEALLRFTQGIVIQRGKISDDDFAALLKAGFSQAELVEIIANIALNIFTNYLNLVAKTEIECGLGALRSPVTAGQTTNTSALKGIDQPGVEFLTAPTVLRMVVPRKPSSRECFPVLAQMGASFTTATPVHETETPAIQHPFLKELSPHHQILLNDWARPAHFDRGETIFCEGDPADRFYLIQKGNVVLETYSKGKGTLAIQTLTTGDVLGWSWLFSPSFWHLTARAAEPTDVAFIEGEVLRQECESDHDLGYELLRRLAKVMLNQLQASRRPLLEPPELPDVTPEFKAEDAAGQKGRAVL